MKTECLIGQSQPLLSKLPNRAHVFVFLFLLATHTWRKIHCQGRPFKQHLGRDLKSLQFASKCTFPAVCSFLYYHEMGLLQGLNITFTSRKSRPSFSQHSETVFPFSAQQKCLPAANLDLFWLWILFERNFYHQWSSDSVHALEINHLFSRGLWQGGAHTVLCTWISMSSDQSSQTGRPARRPVSGWAAPSRWSTLEDTIVTGARDWLQVVTHRNPTHTVWVTMVGEASTRIWNRAIFKQGKTTRTCYFG